jgi:AcrR family transcriptional regulator
MTIRHPTQATKAGRRPLRNGRGDKPTRPRTQEERSATTRRELIRSAVSCISELGYVNSTIEVVASHAGVSRGAVQHHFGSRNDLLVAVIEDFGSGLSTLNDIPPDLTFAERVHAAIDLTWDMVKTPHFLAVVQIWLTMQHNPAIRPTIAKEIRFIEQKLDAEWQMLFKEAAVPPERVASIRHLVLAMLRGLALRKLYFTGRAGYAKEIATLKEVVVAALQHPGAPADEAPRDGNGAATAEAALARVPRRGRASRQLAAK